MKELINSIVDGCEYKVDLKGFAPNDIIEYLKSLGMKKATLRKMVGM